MPFKRYIRDNICQLVATYITKCLKYIFLIGYTVLVYHFSLRVLDFDISQCVSSYIFNHYCFRIQDILLCQNIRKKTDISCTDELCLVSSLYIKRHGKTHWESFIIEWRCQNVRELKISVRKQFIHIHTHYAIVFS